MATADPFAKERANLSAGIGDEAGNLSSALGLTSPTGKAAPVVRPPIATGPKLTAPKFQTANDLGFQPGGSTPLSFAKPAAVTPATSTTPESEDAIIAAGYNSTDEEQIAKSMQVAELAKLKANREYATEEQKQKVNNTEREATIAEKYSTDFRKTTDKQKDMLGSSYGYFAPTQESAKDIAGIFSIMMLATMGAGTENKYSGMNALASLTGAMKGYKEGREDVYKKEMASYDKNVAEFSRRTENSLKEMKLALDELSVDKDAAMARARAVAASDAGSMAALKIRSGDLEGALKALQQQSVTLKTHNDKVAALNEKIRQTDEKIRSDKANEEIKRLLASMKGTQVNIYGKSVDEKIRHNQTMEGLAKIRGAGGTPRSATNERFTNNVIRATSEGLRAVDQLKLLDSKTGGGYFGTVVGKGDITSSVAAALAVNVSSEREKMYNATISGLSLEIAMAMSGGYKPDVGLQRSIQETHRVTEEDTEFTAAYKVSDVISKFKASLEVTPSYTSEQKQNTDNLIKRLNQYDTPENVLLKFVSGGTAKEVSVAKPKPVNAPADAKLAKDGHYYSPDPARPGKYIKWD